MTTVDDILFAPIELTKNTEKVDFLVRLNHRTGSYDWKPRTDRAVKWVARYILRQVMMDDDGWMIHFSPFPGPPSNPLEIAARHRELINDGYIFKLVGL